VSKPALPEGPEAVEAILPVSRESIERLRIYVDLLGRWQKKINLVSRKTLDTIWTRHIADSAQALAALPDARRWLDLGSGAGLPGLVTAILLADKPDSVVHLVESDQRKAAFLRAVSRETNITTVVHVARIEALLPTWREPIEAISARALAPLAVLCGYVAPLFSAEITAVFHKGRDFSRELQEANRTFDMDVIEKPSAIEPDGRIVIIRRLRHC